MERVFYVEDELHDERQNGEYASFQAALARVRELAAIPWGEEPNIAPCKNWMNCGRHYVIVEAGVPDGGTPVVEIRRDRVTWQVSDLEEDGDAG
jgi:hypothetical protein